MEPAPSNFEPASNYDDLKRQAHVLFKVALAKEREAYEYWEELEQYRQQQNHDSGN